MSLNTLIKNIINETKNGKIYKLENRVKEMF